MVFNFDIIQVKGNANPHEGSESKLVFGIKELENQAKAEDGK